MNLCKDLLMMQRERTMLSKEELNKLCEALQELQVRRRFAINLVNKQTSAAKGLVRRAFGWRWDMTKEERDAINKRASAIVDRAIADKDQKPEDLAFLGAFEADLATTREAVAPPIKRRATIEKEMVKIVKKLPVHQWQKSVHGFGELALAVIIGECGNPSAYSHADKLKKRFGLAPYSGKSYSTWRRDGGLSAEDWTIGGYNPKRRAEIYAVTEPLFRAQGRREEKELEDGTVRPEQPPMEPYGALYYRRRQHTAETHPEWKKIQSHMDGLRIMAQRLIVDLWSEWRQAKAGAHKADDPLPAAEDIAA